jgi:hypothetical protein
MAENAYASEKSAPADRRSAGPFDVSEVQDVRPYVDFGSIRVSAREQLQMRLEVEEATQRIVAVSMDYKVLRCSCRPLLPQKMRASGTKFVLRCVRASQLKAAKLRNV